MKNHTSSELSLIRKYDNSARRELAFPPLFLLQNRIGEAHYKDQVSQSNGDPIPRSLVLDIKLPDLTCPGHLAMSSRGNMPTNAAESAPQSARQMHDYMAALEREIHLKSRLFDADRQALEIHLEVSSPDVSAAQLTRLCALVEHRFVTSAAVRRCATLAAPLVSPALLRALAASRFNHLRLLCEPADSAPGRLRDLCSMARQWGFNHLEIDLPYGAPSQTLSDLTGALAQLADAAVDKLQLTKYSPPATPAVQPWIDAAEQLACARQLLQAWGYYPIKGKSFARDAHWHDAEISGLCSPDRVGLGLSAISWTGESYYQNEPAQAKYCAKLNQAKLPIQRGAKLTSDYLVRRELIQRLLCSQQIDLAAIEGRYGFAFAQAFVREMQQLNAMAADGLLRLDGSSLTFEPLGNLLVDAVVRVFDGHLRTNVHYLALHRRVRTAMPASHPSL